jgi:hypothetical protein
VARLSESLSSCAAVWKQLHLNQWFSGTRHKRLWKRNAKRELGNVLGSAGVISHIGTTTVDVISFTSCTL